MRIVTPKPLSNQMFELLVYRLSKTEAYHFFTNLARDLADRYPLLKTIRESRSNKEYYDQRLHFVHV